MRLRMELLRALRASPRATLRALHGYRDARLLASRWLQHHGLDEALVGIDAWSARQRWSTLISPTLIMRVGEAWPRTSRTCLDRALARYAFLKASGASPRFVIGLDPSLDAHHQPDAIGHAWVEVGGEPWPHEEVAAYRVSYHHPADRSERVPPACPSPSRPEIQ